MGYVKTCMIALGIAFFGFTQPGQSQTQNQLSGEDDDRVWITIGADAIEPVQKQFSKDIRFPETLNLGINNSNVKIISISRSNIPALSEMMHHKFNRCGGFLFHDNLAQAQSTAQLPLSLSSAQLADYVIDNANGVQQLLAQLSSSNLTSTVNSLAAYNNRYYTQQSGVDAANWISNQWASIASNRSDISVSLYNHSWQQSSVIATIQGNGLSDEIVVIGGHLDSINQSNPSFGRAPGADDNASGIAVITEILRAIVASDYKPMRTIKIMGYAAEEVGLRGSQAIAQAHKNQNLNVVGVAQFDMTGRNGTAGSDVVFMTDYTNQAQNQFMAQLIDTYLTDLSYDFDQCGYGCSDHASWHNQGFAASIPFESRMSDINPTIHTANDSAFDANHALKFARLAAAYIAELAKSDGGTPPPPPPGPGELENGVGKTGLAASSGEDILFTFDVPAGASAITINSSGGSGDADLYVRFGVAPTDSTYDCRPYRNGNNETCNMNQDGGTYYVRLKAYSTFSGVSLVGSYQESGGGGNQPITRTINNISVGQGSWQRYTQEIPAGYSQLTVNISGGSGDADLYVTRGAQSTTSQYDCRPYRNGNSETCSFNNPAAGTWHLDIRGYRAASGVTLELTANP